MHSRSQTVASLLKASWLVIFNELLLVKNSISQVKRQNIFFIVLTHALNSYIKTKKDKLKFKVTPDFILHIVED